MELFDSSVAYQSLGQLIVYADIDCSQDVGDVPKDTELEIQDVLSQLPSNLVPR